ncbi:MULTISPECIES: hemolysin family protein [Gordonia]|jgi:CBS domain containing-hemolysin-like protein|uniref:CBS domain-containing protein n=2 Tax=Gordonia alkanivorans TaxID=84096 RepID=F9W1V7_9ACTN|nr:MULTISPECIES: hemolysin family protein [Gordonia]AZZ82507.1 HlyC/CorC family transporter [Gordonia alkanivorans]ETA05398.1 membrane protein [Gordonia alkanivorans CGMCC 6845]MDH3006932.1 hemolysin family protein [Gordonia alkanivorans]MDH3011846.1 hemolysin family protein [Gordonia alkanivorans]MDH3016446.1 hemolysin family protein [Gordonia alkanivorans]
MGDLWAVVLAFALLGGNAFFVGAEFSLISARRDRLEALAESGKSRARTVIKAGENLSLMLAGAQLGITICSILLGRVGEPAVAHLIEKPLELAHVPHALLHPISFAIALSLVVVLHILLGEMVPKNIALAGPESAAMLLVPVHLMFIRLVRPLISFYNWLANISLRLMRVEPKDELESTVSLGELAQMLGESKQEGLIDAEEHERLTRALQSIGRTVAEVMIPLEKMRSVKVQVSATGGIGPTLGAVEKAVSETGFSRFPVRGSDGTFTGYLHLKDVLDEILDEHIGPDTIIGVDKIRPLPVIASNTPLDEATTVLRRTSSHLGAVVDDNGRTIGIVPLADLVEEFVGNVRDETHRV